MLLPDGSPIMPVPPPMTHRPAACALEVRQQEDLEEVADVERRAASIEADVGADGPRARRASRPSERAGASRASQARRGGRGRGTSAALLTDGTNVAAHASRADGVRALRAWPCVPARRKGQPTKYGNVASRMQTSLQRRRARRRNGGRGRSGGVARTAAVALPLFLFATFLAVAGHRLRRRRLRVRVLRARTCPSRPRSRTSPSTSSRSSGTAPARSSWPASARERREVVTFDEIPPALLDAMTAVEDKTFWTNSGFDPVALGSAALDTLG